MNCLNEYCSVYELIYCTLKSKIFYYIYSRTIHVIIYSYKIVTYYNHSGENSQMSRFGKICGKLALFQKYLAIYHFFSTWVLSESSAWHCWSGICIIKKNNVVLDIIEIEYLFIILELSVVKYLVVVVVFFFFFLLLFVSVGMAWIVKLSGLTLANKLLNGLHAHVRKMHDIQEVSCVKKCKSLH